MAFLSETLGVLVPISDTVANALMLVLPCSLGEEFINRRGGYITLVRYNVHGLKIVASLLLLH